MKIKHFIQIHLRTSRFRILFFLAFILFLHQVYIVSVNAETDTKQKSVLIIHAQDQFLPANIVIDHNIYSALKRDNALNVSIYSEYLEMVRFNSVATQNQIFHMLQVKYSDLKLDLVIITDDTSWEFMEKNGEALFPGVPIVLCGITEGKIDIKSLKGNITGNLKNADIKNTIEDILKVQPDTKQIAVVIGTSDQDAYYEQLARQGFNEYVGRVTPNYIIGFSIEETQQIIANLPPNTVVLYVSMYIDGVGRGFNPRDVVPLLKKATNAPIYGLSETYLDHGIIGGSLLSFNDLSQNASEIALQVLHGKKPSEIPILVSQNKKYFDWKEMQQWKINEKNLPDNSIVINKKLSLWGTYKWPIIGIMLYTLIETLLILFLLFMLRLNKIAKAEILLLNNELEKKVWDRTAELQDVNSMLEESNAELEEEVDERKKVEKQITLMNIGLETKVMERTNELAKMNQKLEENNCSLEEEIAERQRAEDILRESESQFRNALDNAPIPVMLRAENGEVIKISRKWTEITGYSIQDIPTVNEWTAKAYGTDKLRIRGLIKDSYDSNDPIIDGEYQVTTADGNVRMWRFSSANIGKIADGRKLSMVAATDITEHKLFEKALKTSEEKYRLLTEQASDVIWVFNFTKGKFTYISPSVLQLRGLTVEEALNESLEESLTPKSLMIARDATEIGVCDFKQNPETQKNSIIEVQQPCKNGSVIWVELSTKYRYSPIGEIEIVGVSRNIEERKRAEKEILYLSYHDQLTGLYNRRFYEEELERLDVDRNLPLTLVLGDVNGLKLINDSFGHAMGDELLKKVAEVIRKGCRADDIIARLGGDEFVILLPKMDTLETEKLINRFNDLSSLEKVGSLNISISFGYETKNNNEEKIEEIFKKAEDQMYKKKLFESPSMRGKTIQAIINTLHEKNKREEAHSHRVSRFCEKMGQALNLLEGEIQELKTVGLLHDIGKIAIDETILNKPGKLTDDEWKEIRRHPEIGYRILSALNDMSDMANYALYHHERWDGKGYPKGLKGYEIPFVSRIITIADAYDAMTSERSYRSALSEEVVIEELKINAGIQLDPELVDVFITKVLRKKES